MWPSLPDQRLLPHKQPHALALASAHTSYKITRQKRGELASCKSILGCTGANPRAVEVTVAGTRALSHACARVPAGCH
jgi:hypothetical protein